MKKKELRAFVLEEALKIQRGEEKGRIVARNGNPVRIICTDAKSGSYPIIGLEDIGTTQGERIHSYTIKGANYDFRQNDSDLFIEIEIEVNPYADYIPKLYEPILYRFKYDNSSNWNVGVFCAGREDSGCILAKTQTLYTLANYDIIPFNGKTKHLVKTNTPINEINIQEDNE